MNKRRNTVLSGKTLVLLSIFLISVTFSFGQKGNTFRFALLTDLHVTHGGNAAEDLQNAVNQINASDDIEFVLVTGDVMEEGDRKSLQKAKDILDRLKVKYYAIPGILNRSVLRDKKPVGGYSVYEITPDSILVYEQNIGESRRQ